MINLLMEGGGRRHPPTYAEWFGILPGLGVGRGFARLDCQLAPKTKTIVNVVVLLLSNAANVWPFPAQINGE